MRVEIERDRTARGTCAHIYIVDFDVVAFDLFEFADRVLFGGLELRSGEDGPGEAKDDGEN